MPRGTNRDKVSAMVFFLTRAPRTAPELRDLIGANKNADWIVRWLRALEAEGLVQKDGTRKTSNRGYAATVWKWVSPT